MIKKQLILPLIAVALLLASCSSKQEGYYDQSAIDALDQFTEQMGGLTSLSVYVESDITKNGKQVWRQSDVYLSGNDKLHAFVQNEEMRKGIWYNGSDLTIYDYDKNIYDVVAAPSTTLTMIDSAHSAFGFDFPAADFFYPTFTDDMMANFDSIILLDPVGVEDLIELRAVNSETEVYLTIDSQSHFPIKLEIYREGGNQYIGTFGNWRKNPEIDASIFSFSPPEKATKEVIFTAKH